MLSKFSVLMVAFTMIFVVNAFGHEDSQSHSNVVQTHQATITYDTGPDNTNPTDRADEQREFNADPRKKIAPNKVIVHQEYTHTHLGFVPATAIIRYDGSYRWKTETEGHTHIKSVAVKHHGTPPDPDDVILPTDIDDQLAQANVVIEKKKAADAVAAETPPTQPTVTPPPKPRPRTKAIVDKCKADCSAEHGNSGDWMAECRADYTDGDGNVDWAAVIDCINKDKSQAMSNCQRDCENAPAAPSMPMKNVVIKGNTVIGTWASLKKRY